MQTKIVNKFVIIFIFIICSTFLFPQDMTDDFDSGDIDSFMDEFDTETDTDNSNIEPAKEMNFRFSILGDHDTIFRVPVIYDHSDYYGKIKPPRFDNELGVELEYKILSLKSFWELDLIIAESSNIEDILNVRPLENSITLSPWKFNISMGYLYHTWGTADEINPTDNLNPRDYTLGIDKEKLSVLSAKIEFFPVSFMSLEAVYVPFMMNDIYPVDYVEKLKEEIEIDDISIDNPAFDPSTFSLGGKINFYFQYADFSFSYLYDVAPYYTPGIELTEVTAGPYTLLYAVDSVELKKNRLHHFGADIKTNINRFGIWVEVCYTMTEDYFLDRIDIKNHKLSWTAGFDFNFGPNQDFYMNFQYFGSFVPLYDDKLSREYDESTLGNEELPYETGEDEDYYEEYYYRAFTEYLGGNLSGLEMGASFKIQFPFTVEHLSFEPSLAASYSIPIIYDRDQKINYGSLVIKPEFIFSPIDSLDLLVGADLYFSWRQEKDEAHIEIDDESNLGIFYYDSNIYFAVSYKWGFDFYK